MCGEAVCFVRRPLKKWTIGVLLVTPWRCTFSFTDSWYIKLTRCQANAMGAAMFVSYPTAPLCKTQHDWMTASQHPLAISEMRVSFQNVMNISTLSNALVNIREELWLADSDIPPLYVKRARARPAYQGLCHRVLRPWLARMLQFSLRETLDSEKQRILTSQRGQRLPATSLRSRGQSDCSDCHVQSASLYRVNSCWLIPGVSTECRVPSFRQVTRCFHTQRNKEKNSWQTTKLSCEVHYKELICPSLAAKR